MSDVKRCWKAVLAAGCVALPLTVFGPARAQDAAENQREAEREQAERDHAEKERAVEELRARIAREEAEKQQTIEKLRNELKNEAETRRQKLTEFEKREEALRRALEMERQRLSAQLAEEKTRAEKQAKEASVLANKFQHAAEAGNGTRKIIRLKAHDPVAVAPLKLEKAAFLGVSTSPVTAVTREQLKLPRGIGLVVEHVEKGSPADQAGVRPYDILQKLNDQLLVNPHQLSTLVRTYKAGDTVELTVIREGKARTLKAALAEKELPPLDDRVGRLDIAPGRPVHLAAEGDVDVLELAPGPPRGLAALSRPANKTVVAQVRDDLTLVLDRRGNSLKLRASDPRTGKVLFDGPIDTEEQRKTIPRNVAEEMETETFRRIFRDIEQDREMRVFVEPGLEQRDVVIELDALPRMEAERELPPDAAPEAEPDSAPKKEK